MAVKVKLKELLFLAAVFVAHFDLSLGDCEQGQLKNEYRDNIPDDRTKIVSVYDLSDFGEPKISAKSGDVDKYIGLSVLSTSLELYLKNIEELEETTPSGPNPPTFHLEIIDFEETCPIQTVDVRFGVIDTNNNKPFFTDKDGNAKSNFEVRVPMPLPQNVELQSFGAEIYAKDVDMSNTIVTFRVEPEDDDPNDLEIQYGGVVDDLNKVHRAVLRSTATLSYKERRYKLTVEDNGPGVKLNASGTLIVTRNEEESVIRPKFEKSSYTATFKDGTLKDFTVIVKDGKGDVPEVVEEAMKGYFLVSKGTTEEEFIVKSDAEWDKKEDAIFTLRVDGATVESPAETVFIVKYEAEPPKTTHFEQSSYTANLIDGLLENLEIVVIDGSGKLPIIEGEQNINDYFEVVPAPGLVNDKFIVQSNGDTKWEKDYDAVFTLKIDDATLLTPAETVVIVKIEETVKPKVPYFEQPLYSKTLKDGTLEDLKVTVKDGNGDLPIIVETEAVKYFEVANGGSEEEFIVRSIEDATWDKPKDAIFTLQIDDANLEPPVQTVVIAKTGEVNPPKLTRFEQSSYHGQFKNKLLDDLKVKVIDGSGKFPIIFSDEVSDINDYFEVVEDRSFEENKFIVQSKDGKKWEKDYDAVFTLKIDDATLPTPAETVVIVKIEETVKPKVPYFGQPLYSKTLKDGTLEDLKVTVKDGNGDLPIIVETAAVNYFEVANGGSEEEFVVKSIQGITWEKTEDAIFTLQINDANLEPPVQTVVIAKTGQVNPPKVTRFEQSSYHGQFKNKLLDDLKVKVIDGSGKLPIIFSDEVPDINDYFEVVEDRSFEENKFVVQSKDDKKWEKNYDAVFTLKINDPNLEFPAETVVIVQLEKEPETKQPKFEYNFYEAKFEGEILEAFAITVKDGMGIWPTIKETDMQDYFEVADSNGYSDEIYYVKSKNPWTKMTDAIFTLQITGTSIKTPVETVVIVKKVGETQPETPSFEKSHYSGSIDETGKLSINGDIKLVDAKDVKVYFEDEAMESIFTVTNVNGKVTIEKKGTIPSKLEEILLIVVAERDNLKGSTAVLIKIIGGTTPKFDKSFYEGTYEEEEELKIEQIKVANYQSGQNVVVEGHYGQFFVATITNGIVTIAKTADFEDLDEACVSLKLQLKDSNAVLAETSVFLTIQKTSGDDPKFDRCFYKAVYDGVQIYSDFIGIENADAVEVELSDPAQSSLVKVDFEKGRIALVKQPGLDNYPYDQLIVKIKIKSKARHSSEEEAVLVLTINKRGEKTPYFKESYQLVKYNPDIILIATLDVANGDYGNVKLVEQGYGEYVKVVLASEKLVVVKKKNLLELDVDTLGLTFVLSDKRETLVGTAVLIVAIDKEDDDTTTTSTKPPPSGGGDDDEDKDCADTGGYIVGIAVLACLLVLFMVAAVALWYFKFRNRNTSSPYDDLLEDNIVQIDDNQNLSPTSIGDVKYDDSALSNPSFVDNPKRRNTGYVFNPPPPESDEDTTSLEDTKPKVEEEQTEYPDKNARLFERRRSVTFDDNVEKIQIEKSQDGDEKVDGDASKKDVA